MQYEIIDSHCHLDFPRFDRDRKEAIERARQSGVIRMINSGIDYSTNAASLELARRYDFIHATLGLGPQIVPHASEEKISQILSQIERNIDRAVGVGEAGLDFHYCETEAGRQRQIEVFQKVIEIARKYGKPLVIHGREAEDMALQLSRDLDTVVFHCYGGSLETMQQIVDAGHIVSIPTLVCFSEHHQSIAKHLPLENMLIETDSPYLSPRKGRNEPAFVADSVPQIAALKGIEVSEVAETTMKNTRRVFGI
ncbi:MAG: TatD DNase family protein [Methanolobus sp.]|jgi:TatD DNase family protein|nr:TatD DNase family protein [Methanolobus sp.]